jgi:excisionase family DNA binding protein
VEQETIAKYPLLEELLRIQGRPLTATFTNIDAAALFGVSVRTIQSHVADGGLPSRRLMGSARFLSSDLEQYLQQSLKPPRE